MPAALGALRDDHVGAGLGRPDRFRHAAGHERHLATRVVRPRDVRFDVLLGPRPSERHMRRALFERRGETFLLGREDQEIERERLVGAFADGGGALSNLFGVEVMTAHGAE